MILKNFVIIFVPLIQISSSLNILFVLSKVTETFQVLILGEPVYRMSHFNLDTQIFQLQCIKKKKSFRQKLWELKGVAQW